MINLTNAKRTIKIFVFIFLGGISAAIIFAIFRSKGTELVNNIPPETPGKTEKTTIKITSNVEGAQGGLDTKAHAPLNFPDITALRPLPLTIAGVTAGKHTMYAYKKGYQRVTEQIEVLAGKTNVFAIFLYPEIQVLFEKLQTEPDIKSATWLNNETVLYQTVNQLSEGTLTSIKNLTNIPQDSNTSWSKVGKGLIKRGAETTLYTHPDTQQKLNVTADFLILNDAGTKIAGISAFEVFTTDTQTTGIKTALTTVPAQGRTADFKWAPDSSKLLLTISKETEDNLFLIDTTEKSKRRIDPVASERISKATFSPDSQKISYLRGNSSVALDLEGKLLKETDFEEGTVASTQTWLSNDELILIEKEKEMPYLDRIYLINLKSLKKQFLITSATLIGRLDLNFPIQSSPGKDKILLKENNGPLIYAIVNR